MWPSPRAGHEQQGIVVAYDLADIDTIRERMKVGYQAALEALDGAGGDLGRALALLEGERGGGLDQLGEQIREGVKRGLSGQQLGSIRWKLLGQVVGETPVRLTGVSAVAVELLCLLISSSTIETQYVEAGDEAPAG